MKVTVCFGNVRVVVPCGGGDILVRDLIREATLRYKKATGKGPESWIAVNNLQSQGGGILDPDDRLSDVVDDREQILANFDDGTDGAHHHGGGDGASGSSVGTGSPDIFHDGEHKYRPTYPRTDIEVTGEQIASGPGGILQVRRGSEPALNQLPVGPPIQSEHTKRWSAAPIIIEPTIDVKDKRVMDEDGGEEEEEELDLSISSGFKRITRDGSNRLSIQFLGNDSTGYRWVEAAERIGVHNKGSTSLPREGKRKEPLGQANSTSPTLDGTTELIVIRNEPGPLGIHVVPDYDRLGKDRGILVQGIEPNGRIDRDGRLAIYDRIVEINGQNLINMPLQRIQEMFKLSLTSPELHLKIVKNTNFDCLRTARFSDDKENVSMVECEQKQVCTNTKVATVSPTKKVPAISKNLKGLLTANTRKIGRKIEIELVKGPHGLGFSITTRDNPAGGNCPIYIKNIIPKGAAVEDKRLQIGDRLLEVNGIEMTGKSQAEAVAILRNAPAGSKVRIVVSRQEDVIDNNLPRIIDQVTNEKPVDETTSSDLPPNIPPLPQFHLLQNRNDKNGSVAKIISQFQEAAANVSNPADKLDDSMVFPWKHREVVTLNIPVHDSEKAGLGISVKGKTSGQQDLGIFIKSVINGGAASRDKRLRTNDQLLNVNGISLLQQSNSDAMETLRKAMLHTEGPIPGNITLTIARRASSPNNSNNRSFNSRGSDSNLLNSNGSGSDLYQSNESDPLQQTNNSGASGSSTNTVIFNPNYNTTENRQTISPMQTWNPVLDRLTGQNSNKLRNESYYKAAHDTWLSNNNSFGNLTTTTLNLTTAEPILIEDEYGSRVINHPNTRINVHMTSKLNGCLPENRNDHEPDGKATNMSITSDNKSNTTDLTQSQNIDATYASQLSLENPQGFSRDAFGRQSMSEKRHATLDAKSTDTYQRTKKLREERKHKDGTNLVRVGSVESIISVNRSTEHAEYADKLGQLGPSLGMKKSSSLESLQTMVQEIQMQEECDPAYSYRGPSGALKVIRGRGCEESIRAAVVDKPATPTQQHIIDPNHQSGMGAKKHWLLDGPMENEREIDGFNNVRGGPRQSSLNAALDNKHKPNCNINSNKKKPGIFKGIGSMFRFGKHRKLDFIPVEQHYHQTKDDEPQISENQSVSQQEYIQQQVQREPIYQRHGFIHRHAEQVQVIPENSIAPPPIKYRNHSVISEHQRRIDRKLHEQRLAQRHSYYPSDEQQIQQRLEQNFSEYGRPGSRSGITESVPFTHYVNYNELQNHLSRKDPLSDSQIVQMRLQVQQQRLKVEEESRKQHQYHSQRQTRTDNQLRPVSNFYEYESVQSMLNGRSRQHQNQQQQYLDVNSNSLTRQTGQPIIQTRHISNRNFQQNRGGPFVTHVTIGEQQQQQQQQKNGTKV